MVAGLIGILPLLVADYILLLVNNALSYAIPVTLLLITYVSLGTLLSMLQSKNYGIFLIFAFFFLVPIGVLFTIDTLLGMIITPPETISLLFYYFATPLAQYYLSKKLISGNVIIYSNLSVLIDIIVLLISLIIFVKSEIK